MRAVRLRNVRAVPLVRASEWSWRAYSQVSSALTLKQRVPGRGWQAVWPDPAAASGIACEGTGPLRRRQPPFSTGAARCTDPSTIADEMTEWLIRSAVIGFLPSGYPRTVSDSYTTYVKWTAVSLLAGKMQAVLATQATLFAIGLGTGSIPMAAAVQWVLKDGFGHAGAIVYASAVSTRFDADAKRYRFHATCALTVSDAIAATLPLVPHHFLLLASLSSAIGSIANLAHVAARARVMASFARVGNLADCVRAGQTQSKLMSLAGTSLGAALSWIIGPEPAHVLACLVPLAGSSLFSAYRSSALVVLPSLNVQRTERVYAALLQELDRPQQLDAGTAVAANAPPPASVASVDTPLAAPTPSDVARVETFGWPYVSVLPGQLYVQPLFGEGLVASLLPRWTLGVASRDRESWGVLYAALPLLQAQYEQGSQHTQGCHPAPRQVSPGANIAGVWCASWHGAYAIAIRGGEQGSAPTECKLAVALWHGSQATPADKLHAMWHASVLRHFAATVGCGADARAANEAAAARACASWPLVYAAMEAAGWDLSTAYLDGDGGSLKMCTT